MELTVDDVWQIADAGDQELQRLARNNRRGNLELGAEDSAGQACVNVRLLSPVMVYAEPIPVRTCLVHCKFVRQMLR